MLPMSVLVTALMIGFVPHARRSRFFDLLLWPATIVVVFLCAWLALGFPTGGALAGWATFLVFDLPVVPALFGAVAGAFLLNLSLWVVDQFNPPVTEEEDTD